MCGANAFERVFKYDAPPDGETLFEFSNDGTYRRNVLRCSRCCHFISEVEVDLSALYEYDYVERTYGGIRGVRRAFDRISNLPPEKSDNVQRVRRIQAFAADFLDQRAGNLRLLDVGSGLGVFPDRIVAAGWECVALDTDRRLTDHIRERVGVPTVCARFSEAGDLGEFDLITFNKVLEHVEDPVALLEKCSTYLARSGFVYIELPDGEVAVHYGPGREEFFIEHHHIFSFASIALLARRAGFEPVLVERLQEPSSKYTLRAFVRPIRP